MADILVVDNNRCINDLLSEILMCDGHDVTTAETGSQASQLIGQKLYDVAFIDLGLPDMDGLALIRELKQNCRFTIPVVISGRSDFQAAVMSLKAGAYDYLLKPFDIDEVIQVAKAAAFEGQRRINTGYSHAPSNLHAPHIQIRDLLGQILNYIGVALAFMVGLIAQQVSYGPPFELSTSRFREILFLAASLSFSWAFLTTSVIESAIISGKRTDLKNDIIKLACTYAIFTTILFFVSPLTRGGLAVPVGYVLGLAVLAFNRRLAIPWITFRISHRREGHKRIVIVGSGRQTELLLARLRQNFGRRYVEAVPSNEWIANLNNGRNSGKQEKSDSTTELYLEGGVLDQDEVNKLVNDFAGKRVIINISDNYKSEIDKESVAV
jgi:CheY-like chemotaxis protein